MGATQSRDLRLISVDRGRGRQRSPGDQQRNARQAIGAGTTWWRWPQSLIQLGPAATDPNLPLALTISHISAEGGQLFVQFLRYEWFLGHRVLPYRISASMA